MEKKKSIESIIFRYLTDSASNQESEQLIDWLNESRENRITYFTLKKIWQNAHEPGYDKGYIEDSLSRLKLRTTQLGNHGNLSVYRPKIALRKLSVAATIFVLIGMSLFIGLRFMNLHEHDQAEHEITVPYGARASISLPDGSSVWLNAGSSITYRSDFSRNNRHVSLTGEAYFDVKPDKDSHFIVNTRDMAIKVLGTKFNVKSYPDEAVTETTLIDGSIEILIGDNRVKTQPVRLSPNQRMVYTRDTREVRVQEQGKPPTEDIIVAEEMEMLPEPGLYVFNEENIADYVSWKEGRLTFRGESLKSLAPKLERHYNVSITFLDDSIKTLRYTGALEKVSIEEVMRAISSASDISFTIEKNQIILDK